MNKMLQNILDDFHPTYLEEGITYTLGNSSKKFKKALAHYVRPKDKEKIIKALTLLAPYILNKSMPQPNSPLSIYDFHVLKTGDRGDFHVSSYTIILQYNEYDRTVVVDDVGSYTNIGLHH